MFTRSKQPLEDPVLECRTMFSLGEVMLKLADTQVAQARLKDSVTLATRIQDDATLWRAYTLLAKIAQNETEPEVPVTELLKSALSHFRSPQAGVFPSPERLGYPTTRQDLGEQLVALLAKHKMSQEALIAAEQLKDELFIVEWNRRGGKVKPEDADIYNDLMTMRAHLHVCEDGSPPSSLMKEWQKWIERFRQLVADNRRLARLIAPLPNSAEQILVSVRNNKATMIDYLVGANSSVVFTMDGTGRFSATVIPVGQARLKDRVNALVNGMRAEVSQSADPQASERMLLQTLYKELIPPAVSACLPANPEQMVVIVPDGVLYNLPFAALIDDKGKYLIEAPHADHGTLTWCFHGQSSQIYRRSIAGCRIWSARWRRHVRPALPTGIGNSSGRKRNSYFVDSRQYPRQVGSALLQQASSCMRRIRWIQYYLSWPPKKTVERK